MAIKYQGSHVGIGEMLKAPWLADAMHDRILPAKDLAEAIAPVDETGPHPGRYKASFEVESGIREGKEPRAYARLRNIAPEALAVEFGTQNNPAHHTLVRSLDAIVGARVGGAVVAPRDGGSKARQARRRRNEKARARRAAKKAEQ